MLEIISRHTLRHIERHFYAFYESNEKKRQLATIQFVKRMQNSCH